MAQRSLTHGYPDGELLAPVEPVLGQRQARVWQVACAACAALAKVGIALIHALDGARARVKGGFRSPSGGGGHGKPLKGDGCASTLNLLMIFGLII